MIDIAPDPNALVPCIMCGNAIDVFYNREYAEWLLSSRDYWYTGGTLIMLPYLLDLTGELKCKS